MRKIRYAVLGLGDIAQEAVLPAFNDTKSSELVALISGDPEKLDKLSAQYKITRTYRYEQLEDCLMTGDIDAVYIATPNQMHRDHTERVARKGVSVLCEKPMAPSVEDCQAMIRVCRENGARLMIAYRLHFERSNLDAIEIAQSGKLGDLRIFSSVFSQQVKPGNVRVTVPEALGGGSVWDMGVYCINAARYLFRQNPTEVTAFSASGDSTRFREVDEMTSAILRFPDERLATFTSSFGAASAGSIALIGTEGRLEIEPAYDYSKPFEHRLTIGGKTTTRKFSQVGQFAAEIDYFSECLCENREPEPSGEEGLEDVRIIDAIYRSAMTRQPVSIEGMWKKEWPSEKQKIDRPEPDRDVEKVHVSSPTFGS